MTDDTNPSDVDDWTPVSLPAPAHWARVNFEEAFVNVSLNGIKIPQAKYLRAGQFPVIDQGKELIGGYTDAAENVINKHGAVIVFGDHTKCFKFVPFPFAPGADGTKVLAPAPFLKPKYAFYACLSLRLPDRGYSRHYSFLKKGTIPVAPLGEQDRIVAKIEELFSELDKCVESLTTTCEQLAVYRLVVLHRAVSDESGSHYPTKPLDELIGPIGQGWSPKCDVNTPAQDDEWAIVKTTAVQPMSYLPHECKPLPRNLKPRPGIEIQDGDILMTRKGPRPRTGVVCHVSKARPRSMLCDTVYRFRAIEEIVRPEYLEIALNAPSIVQEIDARKSGISESGISLNHGKLRSLPIPVPNDLASQERIVQTVRERLSVVEFVGALIEEQARRVEALRQSILQRAFCGMLVALDPADEPASVLLEGIQTEREDDSLKDRQNKNGRKEAA